MTSYTWGSHKGNLTVTFYICMEADPSVMALNITLFE